MFDLVITSDSAHPIFIFLPGLGGAKACACLLAWAWSWRGTEAWSSPLRAGMFRAESKDHYGTSCKGLTGSQAKCLNDGGYE